MGRKINKGGTRQQQDTLHKQQAPRPAQLYHQAIPFVAWSSSQQTETSPPQRYVQNRRPWLLLHTKRAHFTGQGDREGSPSLSHTKLVTGRVTKNRYHESWPLYST